MTARFLRCPHCGQDHPSLAVACPFTGRLLRPEAGGHGGPRPPLMSQPTDSSVTTAPLARRDLLGRTVGGKYVVRCVLGQGGMGTVYEAEHIAIGRQVAVKVLHPKQLRKREAVKRFHHEARAAGSIGHPNICEVYDLGTLEDGCPYLVMEKLVGRTLADRIKKEGGLPFDDILDVLTQVLSGLVAAHEKNIVHRDIKPENVFLTERVGCPPLAKLLDFGVSKMVGPVHPPVDGEDEMDLTRTGMVMGTPYYMSPEQARGDRNLDARVDLYACGVLLYEALTGRRPFLANNYNALLLSILSAKPTPARELRRDLPPELGRVIEKAMSRRREDRYQSATDFQRDLQRQRGIGTGRPREPSIVELPSSALSTPSSVDIPVVVDASQVSSPSGGRPLRGPQVSTRGGTAPAPPRRRGPRGFDDLSTEIKLADFSDSDDMEPATTLMGDEEIAALARSARRSSPPSISDQLPDAPFDPSATEVTKTAVKRSPPQPTPEPFHVDETVRMHRGVPAKPPPSHRRARKG